MKIPPTLYLPAALCLLLASCATPEHLGLPSTEGLEPSRTVHITALADGRLQLSFPLLPQEPAFQRLSVEDARKVLAQFHEDLARLGPETVRKTGRNACTQIGGRLTPQARDASLQLATYPSSAQSLAQAETLREQYTARYGESPFPLPACLEDSPLVMALRLSPRHMPEGVRKGFEELVNDPAFLAGMATAIVLYGLAWVAPEPLFSKGFAASVTVVLLTVFSFAELTHFGMVAYGLYRDTQGAKSLEEVEAAAERFGRYVGGAGVRILAFVAMKGVAKNLKIPPGGLLKLWPRRLSLPGGASWGLVTTASAVPTEGALFVTGVASGTAGSALRSACQELAFRGPGYSRHHLATNKNLDSDVSGGPWTPRFALLFRLAGMDLDDEANLVNLLNHFGPHPEEYHEEIHDRLRRALGSCKTQLQCRAALVAELRRIADEVCTPGSRLHRLITR